MTQPIPERHQQVLARLRAMLPGWGLRYRPREHGWVDLEGFPCPRPAVIRVEAPSGGFVRLLEPSTRRVGRPEAFGVWWSTGRLCGRGWVEAWARTLLREAAGPASTVDHG